MHAVRTHRTPLLCRLLPALLALCLLLQAQTAVLRQLLGSAHWHRPAAAQPAADAGWWTALQAWRADLLARRPLAAGHALAARHADHGPHAGAAAGEGPDHHHDHAVRHHHAPHDATVVALDSAAGDGDPLADATAGSLMQPLVLSDRLRLPARAEAAGPVAGADASPWQDAALRRLERPPRG